MNKNILFQTLNHEKTERVPWVPYTGVQIGSLQGCNAEKLYRSSDLLLKCLKESNRLYSPDGQPVIFDLQIEAEALGANLIWADKAPPCVSSHPLSQNKNINLTVPKKDQGRIPMVLNVMREFKKYAGHNTGLYGLITGPLTLASHLRGTDIFMDMYDDEEYVKKLINFSLEVCLAMSDYYIENGMDVIASVDPLVSQISPDCFSNFLSEPYKYLFGYLRKKQVFGSFFVCGDATKNIEMMSMTKPDCISIDENINIAEAKKITDRHNVVISGNLQLTIVMLLGNQQDNMKAALELIDSLGSQNFILAPGCDMPYDVPRENLVAVAQAVQNPQAAKQMLSSYTKARSNITVVLPDYKNLKKPLIELITLDSAQCAACGYMKSTAEDMLKIFGDKIEVIEYKFTEPETIARAGQLGIKNVPSLLINGKLKYSSIIPPKSELEKEIRAVM